MASGISELPLDSLYSITDLLSTKDQINMLKVLGPDILKVLGPDSISRLNIHKKNSLDKLEKDRIEILKSIKEEFAKISGDRHFRDWISEYDCVEDFKTILEVWDQVGLTSTKKQALAMEDNSTIKPDIIKNLKYLEDNILNFAKWHNGKRGAIAVRRPFWSELTRRRTGERLYGSRFEPTIYEQVMGFPLHSENEEGPHTNDSYHAQERYGNCPYISNYLNTLVTNIREIERKIQLNKSSHYNSRPIDYKVNHRGGNKSKRNKSKRNKSKK